MLATCLNWPNVGKPEKAGLLKYKLYYYKCYTNKHIA